MMRYPVRIAIGAGLGLAAVVGFHFVFARWWVGALIAALLGLVGFLGSFFIWSADRLDEGYEQVLFDLKNNIVSLVLVLVLVGASFGGLDAQLFAFTHPDDVAGVVLVDSLHPDFDRRIEQLLPPKVAKQRRAELGLNQEHIAFAQIVASEREVAEARVPLQLPLTVIRHGLPFSTAAGWPAAKVERLWLGLQSDLTRLTDPPGRLVLAARSGHRTAEQQPALVAAEIVRVVTAAR